MTTTVFSCPKCRTPVRLEDGETKKECTGCGAVIERETGAPLPVRPVEDTSDKARQTVATAALVALVGGALAYGFLRIPAHKPRPAAAPETIYTAPPVAPVAPTPEGEVAWEVDTRTPVVTKVHDDGTEDVAGFVRVWNGRSAWIAHAGVFDGKTYKPLWLTEAIDPQLVKRPGVLPFMLPFGARLAVADTSSTLRVYDLTEGDKEKTFQLSGPVMDLCAVPGQPDKVWVAVVPEADAGSTGPVNVTVDVTSSKMEAAARPASCPAPAFLPVAEPPHAKKPPATPPPAPDPSVSVCADRFLNRAVAHATCKAVPAAGDDGFVPAYELSADGVAVELGTKKDLPFARSRAKGGAWERGFVADDTKAKPFAPKVAELSGGRLYAVYEKVYFDARLAAFDAHTGAVIWDVPLAGSLPRTDGQSRGDAHALIATPSRIYVVRTGGGLDVLEASSGKLVGSIGKQ